ncbi:MAG: MCP four helix bundle domain-containing protein [Anaerolineae bacterium]|nr:MCP four helix bundle domain-containing protein [Anaerolineae bacterium]
MSFKNLKIGGKINAAIMFVLVLMIVVAGAGIFFLYQSNQQIDQIVNVLSEKLVLSGNLSLNLAKIGRAEKNMILAETEADMDTYAADVEKYTAQVEADLDALTPLIDERGQAGLAEFKQQLDAFLANNTQVRTLTRAGENTQATALSQGAGQELYNQAEAGMAAIVERAEEDMQTYKATSDQSFLVALYSMIGIGVVGLAGGLALGLFISRGITAGLRNMIEVAVKIAEGDINQTVKVQSNDEVGELAITFQQMIENLNSTMQQINAALDQVVQSVEQVQSVSQDLAANAEEQSSAVEEVTSNLEETDAQVKANADNSNLANQLVTDTGKAADVGQKKMEGMTQAMTAIADGSRQIGKIIKAIDEIAFQTNLLALNAAVEAARAGQHGRGFAVVAQEVRNLAGRSAKAAKETAELIEDAGNRVQDGVEIAGETAESLNEIVQNVVKVKDLVAEIAAASEEQTKGLTQISSAMVQVNNSAQGGSQQSEELASTADELGNLADRLRNEVKRFKLRQQQVSLGAAMATGSASWNGGQASPAKNGARSKSNGSTAAVNGHKEHTNGHHALVLPLDRDERGYNDF